MSIGLIGGSGIYRLDSLSDVSEVAIDTPFGTPSAPFIKGKIQGQDVLFLARHGNPHSIPPHKVNYRANIWGLKELGVKRILSVNAVGGIHKDFVPGSIALVNQIIDFTFGSRQSTFFEDNKVIHIDFTEPFCSDFKAVILRAAKDAYVPVLNKGVYICVNGPRLETAQEIRAFSKIGADVVGMTLMPEASLAREMEMCFASLSVVTNVAAGISRNKLTTKEVLEVMKDSTEKVSGIIERLICSCSSEYNCLCQEALKDASL